MTWVGRAGGTELTFICPGGPLPSSQRSRSRWADRAQCAATGACPGMATSVGCQAGSGRGCRHCRMEAWSIVPCSAPNSSAEMLGWQVELHVADTAMACSGTRLVP